MEIRKGPYGLFMVETITGNLNKYTTEIIANNIPGSFVRFYIASSPLTGKTEISYDCTNLTSFSKSLVENTDRILLRKAVGDLFLSFIKCLDLLIPLNGIIWSDSYIFWDQSDNHIKMCIRPYTLDNIDISLSSLGNGQIEELLNNISFSNILSSDEISSLCYAITNNDEDKLEDVALRIKKEDPETLLNTNKTSLNLFKYQISFVILLILLSILGITNGNLILWGLGCILAVVLLYKILKGTKATSEQTKTTINKITHERKNIYFDDTETKGNIISGLILKSQNKIQDKYINKAIYSTRATIGSDPFLSDIHIDDDSISEIHIEITKENNEYFVVDLSRDNSTYIDNRRIDSMKKYGIKNGQVLRCGNYDFNVIIN